MIYVTIIVCTLFITITILGWKYLSRDFAIEAAQDTQLNDISVICSKIINKYNASDEAPDSDKYKYLPSNEQIRDTIESIYSISIRNAYNND